MSSVMRMRAFFPLVFGGVCEEEEVLEEVAPWELVNEQRFTDARLLPSGTRGSL